MEPYTLCVMTWHQYHIHCIVTIYHGLSFFFDLCLFPFSFDAVVEAFCAWFLEVNIYVKLFFVFTLVFVHGNINLVFYIDVQDHITHFLCGSQHTWYLERKTNKFLIFYYLQFLGPWCGS